MAEIYAKEDCLRTWNGNSDFSRLDYFSPHRLEELHDRYFKNCMWRFSIGDLIYVRDPEGRRAELEILYIDDEANTITFGLIREMAVKPITPSGYAIEKRRTGSGFEFFVIGPDGKTMARDLYGEKNAKKALQLIEGPSETKTINMPVNMPADNLVEDAPLPKKKARALA